MDLETLTTVDFNFNEQTACYNCSVDDSTYEIEIHVGFEGYLKDRGLLVESTMSRVGFDDHEEIEEDITYRELYEKEGSDDMGDYFLDFLDALKLEGQSYWMKKAIKID